jgi:hypothetical protein
MKSVGGLLLLCLLALPLCAQDTGSLTGTVKDSSGATVSGAQVTVTDPAKGVDRQTITNADGGYLVPGLAAAAYDIHIEAAGFQKYEVKGVVLRVAQKARADAVLKVGAASTEITVQGQNVAQVETQTNELAGTVTGKEITQLQLNGRNFTQLAALVPGVSNQSGQDEGTVGIVGNVAMSFNGGRTEYNNWELDGGDNMDNGSNTSLNVYPSVDAVSEVRVLTSNYGAQYGRNGSGTVETEIKSGTSSFHGNVYEFLRNDAFNARNYFESTVPEYKKNDFGYTIGGPVYIPGVYNTKKDKTFFFWSQEWRRDRVPGQVFNQQVPSMAERAGNFSDLCPNISSGTPNFSDCPKDPATGAFTPLISPTATGLALLGEIPEPNAGVPGAALFNSSPVQPTNWREELLRIDHNFTPKIRGMFHYVHDSWDTINPTPLWTNGTSFPTIQTKFVGPAVSLVAKLSVTASPTLLNEFVFSYTTDHITLLNVGNWQKPAGFAMGSIYPISTQALPGINVSGNAAYGDGFSEDVGYIPNGPYNSNPTYTYRDNVSKILGRHNLQFGAYAVTAQKNELGVESGVGGLGGYLNFGVDSPVTTGNAFADLLLGNISSFGQQNVQAKYYNRYKILEPYFQDDWRVNDHLTLNLGLRVSLFGTYRERYQNAYNFDPSAWNPAAAPQVDASTGALIVGPGQSQFNGLVQCGVNGAPPGCQRGHLFNPAPRIGFAWDPKGDGKTAIRGGYGIFFEHTNGNEGNAESLENSPPLVQSASQSNIVGYQNIGTSAAGTPLLFPLSVVSIPSKAVWPYVQQWHLDIQREVVRNTVATISYVGSKGTHLTRRLDINQLNPVPSADNPYGINEPFGGGIDPATGDFLHDDCGTQTTPSGIPITGVALFNLYAACGNDVNPFRPFRGFGGITRIDEGASSIYHGLQFAVRRSVGALQLNAAYTYSHSIDDSSSGYDAGFVNSYDPSSARASSNFDMRHMLNVGYVIDLPFFKSPGLKNKLLGGWQYSGITTWQTGTPFNVVYGLVSDNAGVGNTVSGGNGTATYLDVVGDPNANVPSSAQANVSGFGPVVANPAAFVLPRGLTFGDTGRNFLRNPNRTNFDMALFKHFAIKESMGLEFRAEAFNVFNHTQFGPIYGDAGSAANNGSLAAYTNTASCFGGPSNSAGDSSCLGTSSFLHVASAHPARILQLGLKFLF